MRIAIVYDRVNKWGGAERILLALHEMFPDAPLFTSVYEPKKASWARRFQVKPSFLQAVPLARTSHEYFPYLMPLAFESFSFSEFDLVISVTSEAAKGVITLPRTKHICYCLTPTRYLWSGYAEYFPKKLFERLLSPIVSYLRAWDKIASRRPDKIFAISDEVRRRVKRYYGLDSAVIYPPISISAEASVGRRKGSYFLVVSRLVSYKRVDIAIKACNMLQLPLKIVGVGSEMTNLKKIAGPTVEFIGSLTDEELVEYYKGCLGLLFPGTEDFGLTILEAQKYGKPVIAYRAGGALETIKDGKTGIFFYPKTASALVKTLKKFRRMKFSARICHEQATHFTKERFKEQFLAALRKEGIDI